MELSGILINRFPDLTKKQIFPYILYEFNFN